MSMHLPYKLARGSREGHGGDPTTLGLWQSTVEAKWSSELMGDLAQLTPLGAVLVLLQPPREGEERCLVFFISPH